MNKWYIPDCYYPGGGGGIYVSHEAVCFLNEGDQDAEAELTLYFEDRDKMSGFKVAIPAERTIHCRMDRITDRQGHSIPRDTPYALVIESENRLQIQYTRVDTTQPNLAVMTVMA